MFLPIGDENPRERTPYVNFALLGLNALAFVFLCFPQPGEAVLQRWAIIPAALEWPTLFSSMFLHANLLHLGGNMLFLWIFGDNVEDRLGHLGYLAFYLAAGLAAGLAHVAANAQSDIPTLGASGAISGVIGAYAVFFPRHRVKMLLWFFFYVEVLFIPAVWWIGIWFAEQLLLSRFNAGGGVAYLAHIGGFLAGIAAAGGVRLFFGGRLSSLPLPEGVRAASRSRDGRRPFVSVQDDPGVVFVEDPADRYAVLRLSDDLHAVGRIGELVSEASGEKAAAVVRRLEATRGMIARGLPRLEAERLQRALKPMGVPTALVLDHPANAPARPAVADAVAWDETALRLRVGDGSVTVPWAAPFLYVGARVAGTELVDVFAGRRSAFRVTERAALKEVLGRGERTTDLDGFAAAVVRFRSGAALNEGIRVLAGHGAWGWLAFRTEQDYDDYLFWLYNLILSRVPLHRG